MSILKKLKSLAPALSAVVVAACIGVSLHGYSTPVYAVDIPETTKNQMRMHLNRRMQIQLKKRKKRIRKKTRTKKKSRKVRQKVHLMYQMERITEQEPDLREKSKLRLP